MPASWEYRGAVLVVTEAGDTPNAELERAFVHEALRDPRAQPGQLVLFDARQSIRPLSIDDMEWRVAVLSELVQQNRLARLALLVGPHQTLTAMIAASMEAQVPGLRFAGFTSEDEATAWLASTA